MSRMLQIITIDSKGISFGRGSSARHDLRHGWKWNMDKRLMWNCLDQGENRL
jgi:hypothetical protein